MPASYSAKTSTTAPLRFIDLFCGIGGFRIAFEKIGARCVFSSDWDKYSRITYADSFQITVSDTQAYRQFGNSVDPSRN